MRGVNVLVLCAGSDDGESTNAACRLISRSSGVLHGITSCYRPNADLDCRRRCTMRGYQAMLLAVAPGKEPARSLLRDISAK